MSQVYNTVSNTVGLVAHADLKGGMGVVIGTSLVGNTPVSAAPTAGGQVDGVVMYDNFKTGQVVPVAIEVGTYIPTLVSEAVTVGQNLSVGVNMLWKVAAAGDIISAKTVQAGATNSVVTSVRVSSYVMA